MNSNSEKLIGTYRELGVSERVYLLGEEVLASLEERFRGIDRISEMNQCKVLHAMQKNRVNATHFAATTGYGYDDGGRDTLEKVYADVFHTEAALGPSADNLRDSCADSCAVGESASGGRAAFPGGRTV